MNMFAGCVQERVTAARLPVPGASAHRPRAGSAGWAWPAGARQVCRGMWQGKWLMPLGVPPCSEAHQCIQTVDLVAWCAPPNLPLALMPHTIAFLLPSTRAASTQTSGAWCVAAQTMPWHSAWTAAARAPAVPPRLCKSSSSTASWCRRQRAAGRQPRRAAGEPTHVGLLSQLVLVAPVAEGDRAGTTLQ